MEEIQATEGQPSADDILSGIATQATETDSEEGETPTSTDTLKIGEKEFSLTELNDLITKGEKARDLEAASTKRFMEAAELRKELEAKQAEMGDVQVVLDAYNTLLNGTPTQKQEILNYLAQQARLDASFEGQANPTDFTDNEQFLYAQVQKLGRELQAAHEKIGSVTPVLEDVKGYVGQNREQAQLVSDAQAIKEKFGLDLTPEQVKDLKAKGNSPVALFEFMTPMLQAAFSAGAQKTKASDDIPGKTLSDNTFDPDLLDADEIVRAVAQGKKPVR